MTDEKINRINFLSRKSKAEGLSDAEKAEQQVLRDEYRAAWKQSMTAQLDNTYILENDGTIHKAGVENG